MVHAQHQSRALMQPLLQRYDLKPAMEFRCFVLGGRLVGVSQRHTGEHYPFLSEQRASLAAQLDEFHETHVAPAFPHPDCACEHAASLCRSR
jgi:hypothetical protein